MSGSKFTYITDTDYSRISAEDHEKVGKLLSDFKKGYLYPLESHIMTADSLRKYLQSGEVSPEVRAEFRKKSKDVEDELMVILRAFSELEGHLEQRELDNTCQREYYNIFKDADIEPAKMDFIRMLKAYEYLKTFNDQARDAWNNIRAVFEPMTPSSLTRPFLEQVLTYKVYPRIELCEQTDLLLRRMHYILQIEDEEFVNDHWQVKGKYTSLIRYGIASLFSTELDQAVSNRDATAHSISAEAPAEHEAEKATYAVDSAIKNPFFLDTRGNQLFNQSYLYILKIDSEKIQIEEQKIKRAVYIETHLGAEEAALRKDLIRKFISQARTKDRISEYTNFLYEYFDFTHDTLMLHFMNFEEDQKGLLMYHLGPIYFLKTVMHFMREGRTGFIHRRLKREQMVRELPFEFLKFTLKDWWDEKIYQQTTRAGRNSIEEYDNLIRYVKEMWRNEQQDVLRGIRDSNSLLRFFNLHDVNSLKRFLVEKLSFLFYAVFNRFLGPDFIYMQTRKKRTGSAATGRR